MTAAAEKIFVVKSVTVGLNDNTLKDINDAAKKVGAPTDCRMASGGPVQKNAENTEQYQYSATFSWSEEV